METTSSKPKLRIDTPGTSHIGWASSKITKSTQWRLYFFSLLINDILAIGFAFWLAHFLRFEFASGLFNPQGISVGNFYQNLVLYLIPLWLIIFVASGLYNRHKLLGGTEEYALVFNATSLGMLLVIAVGFLEPSFIFARGWLILAWVFAFLLTALGRFVLRRVIYFLRQRGYFLANTVIIGANNEGISLARQLLRWKTSGLKVLGFVDQMTPNGDAVHENLAVLGKVHQLDEIIKNYHVEELILASSALSSREKMVDIFQRFGTSDNVNVRFSSGLYEIITTGLTVKEFAYVPLVGVNKVRLTGFDLFLKLLLDYCIILAGLVLISPLLFLIALAIKIDSPGPVIYRRRVMGVNGKQFDALKFRSMHTNGDEILAEHPELVTELAINHKLKHDPRITKVGGLLRKTSLDELPQLINVLKREMSLVGPRMITPEEVEKYDHWDINLLTVPPGITGLWQVSGRSDVSYQERVRLDMYYIRNWSIWLDLQILLQTIPAVLKRTGAY